jgi:tetratricopeptide (TPR) repeat protein
LHEPQRRGWWLAAASLAYGLAVGARPSLLPGAVILLVPVVQAWCERFSARLQHERRKVWTPLLAATGPMVLIGLGLMLYNALRFDNPFEFGFHYAMAGERQVTRQFFNPHYLWFNFRVYFLEPARWSGRFPFVHDIRVPPLPAGYTQMRRPFGVLTNIPLVWLALAVPLAWRGRSGPARSVLRWFAGTTALLFGMCALTLGLFCGSSFRYEEDFLPALLLLAVVGILGLERVLAPTLAPIRDRGQESGQACRPVWRRAGRWGWGLLLGFSVAFNLLVSVERCAEAHYNLGGILFLQGKVPEAVAHYEQALRLNPDYAEAHNYLGLALWQTGKVPEAMAHYEQALRLNPDYAGAHNNLGVVLVQLGRMQEAIGHYEQALRLRPGNAEVHNNLGVVLVRLGRMQEAIGHYEQALRLKPDFALAHYNLGNVLVQAGRVQDGIGYYEQALRIQPDNAEAHNNLGNALAQSGRIQEAIWHHEQALRIAPDRADLHYNLGMALADLGKLAEAAGQFEQALRLKPDFAEAKASLARLRAVQ